MARPRKQDESAETVKEQEIDTTHLPKKDLFRIDEVANYFNVSEAAIRLWVDHGLLDVERLTRGTLRIPRRSIVNFRLKKSTFVEIY